MLFYCQRITLSSFFWNINVFPDNMNTFWFYLYLYVYSSLIRSQSHYLSLTFLSDSLDPHLIHLPTTLCFLFISYSSLTVCLSINSLSCYTYHPFSLFVFICFFFWRSLIKTLSCWLTVLLRLTWWPTCVPLHWLLFIIIANCCRNSDGARNASLLFSRALQNTHFSMGQLQVKPQDMKCLKGCHH